MKYTQINLLCAGWLLAACTWTSANTVIQSAAGLNCTSNCVNGVCTNTCSDDSTQYRGNGDVIEQSVQVGAFDAVSVHQVEVEIEHGEGWAVTLKADSNLVDNILVQQRNRNLDIKLKSGSYADASLKVLLVMPELKRVQTSGAESVIIHGFDQPKIKLASQGAGKIIGAGNHFAEIEYKSSGATLLDLSSSKTENARLHVDGVGKVKLAFDGKGSILSGELQGVSQVMYCGEAENRLRLSGVSSSRKINCF